MDSLGFAQLYYFSMKNYISINFIYTRNQNYLNRKEFALKHSISYGAMSSYEQGGNLPPIDLIQRICEEYKISIDDFVNKDLSKQKEKPAIEVNEGTSNYKTSDKELNLYNKIIEAKDDQIKNMELRIEELKKQITIFEVLLNQNGIL